MNKFIFLSVIFLVFISTLVLAAQQLTVNDDEDFQSVNLQTPSGDINIQGDGNSITMTTPNGTISVETDENGEATSVSITGPNGEEITIDAAAAKAVTNVKIKGGLGASSLELSSASFENPVEVELSNGKNAEVKVMPALASAVAISKMKAKCELNSCTVELKEVGSGSDIKVQYEVKAKKKAKFLGLFGTDMEISADVDASTGKVIEVNRPWWSFLASEEDVSA